MGSPIQFFYHVITVIIVHSLPIIILLTSSFLICSFSMALIFLIMINHVSKNTSVSSFSYNPWQLIRINVANLVLRWLRSSIIPPLKPLSNAKWLLLSLRTRLRILSLEKIQTLIMPSELPHWKNFFLSNLMQARPLSSLILFLNWIWISALSINKQKEIVKFCFRFD